MRALIEARKAIAMRAFREIGTPFHLYGRSPGKALDCVGLALIAAGRHARGLALTSYSLKGDQLDKVSRVLTNSCFDAIAIDSCALDGDLIFVAPGPMQGHFMVRASAGWVHADAGLGRVVHRPGSPPWAVCAAWRLGRI